MKTTKNLFVLTALFVIASKAIAAPFVWTIPQTAMADGSTISGSFTYDSAATPPLSAVNIVKTAPDGQTYSTVGGSDANYIRAAAGTGSSVPAIYLTVSGIPASGGTFTKSVGSIGIGVCNQTSGCLNVSGVNGGYIANIGSVTYTSQSPQVTPAAIPTLSEWGMIFMASLMAMFGIRIMRRSK